MDEISALKLIFRGEFQEESGIVLFNNSRYDYSAYRLNKTEKQSSFFSLIAREEERITEHKSGTGPQFDALTVDYQKISDEQFAQWRAGRGSRAIEGPPNGKTIWLEQNSRQGTAEADD